MWGGRFKDKNISPQAAGFHHALAFLHPLLALALHARLPSLRMWRKGIVPLQTK